MAIRIRQHVNPLERKFQQPILIPNWQEIYTNCDRPWHLDIGCARGKFILEMAQLNPEVNFLGIEIRQPLVDGANQTKESFNLTNLHYLFGNINSSAAALLQSLPKDRLQTISVQFPDPWFKKRHNKRRVVQPELVLTLVDYLADGGEIWLQSDIEEVAQQMRDRFGVNTQLQQQHSTTWLDRNPFPVATERELYVLGQNLPVYRVLFKKVASKDKLAINQD